MKNDAQIFKRWKWNISKEWNITGRSTEDSIEVCLTNLFLLTIKKI